MVADILPANHLHQPRFLQRVEHMVIHTRQHQLNAAVLRTQIQLLQVVDTRRVDERHLAHTDNPHLQVILPDTAANLIKLIGYTEEIRTIYLVHIGMVRDMEHSKVIAVQPHIVVLRGVEFMGERADDRCLVGTLDEEDNRQQQAHLDSHRQVENHRQHKGNQHHDEVRLRRVRHPEEGAPTRHVVTDHHQHARQACHRNHPDQLAQEQQHQQQHYRMHDTCHRRATAVVDIGHRAGNSARRRNAAEERHYHVRHALRYQLGVGVVLIANHTIRHHCRQ